MPQLLADTFPAKLFNTFVVGFKAFIKVQHQYQESEGNIDPTFLHDFGDILDYAKAEKLPFQDLLQFENTCINIDHQVRKTLCPMSSLDSDIAWFKVAPAGQLWYEIHEWFRKHMDEETDHLMKVCKFLHQFDIFTQFSILDTS